MKGTRVLVIDDDQAMVQTLKDGLRSLGCRVFAAYDGYQGFVLAQQERPDVILLDFNMPAGGGAVVYERLRNSTDTRRIPVVFTTAVKLEEVQQRVRAGPHTYFVKKPIALAQLKSTLEQVLADEEAEAPKKNGHFHEFKVRVMYADTDRMGVTYYANYYKFFELGRTELFRSLGLRYRDLEEDRKLFLPVTQATCDYLGASRYDDLLVVRTRLAKLGQASVEFSYEIFDRKDADRLVARGATRHALVGENWKPVKIPDDLRKKFERYVA